MTNSDSSPATSLTNRYGTPKRKVSKKVQKILIMVAIALSVIWVLWVVIGSNKDITQKDVSYHVVDPTLTTVDIAVTKDADATARCAMKAMDESYAVVGWKVITIGPNGKDVGSENGRTTTVRTELRTDSLAVTGIVEHCWIVES
ncbi:DUF4307 domain-containing protein [Specibacter sp. NPDC078709]|uniref:DUF4307 domain-containing protein n=1 Tax=Specibacter sp. NPDC078709 TaxID=3154364 RepID=UPI003426E3AB